MKKFLVSFLVVLMLLVMIPVSSLSDEVVQDKKYSIYVNRTQNVITIYEVDALGNETLAKTFTCSCGRQGHGTPTGTYKTDAYYEWHLMVDGTYGRYCVRFNNKILFHSVPYLKISKSALEWDQYNLLGEKASLGCVRLAVADAKWIYDNCKAGTKVTVYDDKPGDPVLYKPDTYKIPEDSPYRGWDPTDEDPANPWNIIRTVYGGEIPEEYLTKTKNNESIDGFNYVLYSDMYPDLKYAYGYNKEALYMHYVTYGKNEGRIAIFE